MSLKCELNDSNDNGNHLNWIDILKIHHLSGTTPQGSLAVANLGNADFGHVANVLHHRWTEESTPSAIFNQGALFFSILTARKRSLF